MPLLKSKELRLALVGSVIVVALAIILPVITMRNYPLPDRFALARLALQAAAFPAIFLALYFNLVQLRKSIAKPLIKVAFNERGEQSFTLTYKDNESTSNLPPLWLINDGKAISQHFQIVVIIPESIVIPDSIGKILTYTRITRDNGNCIFSYTNDEDYTLFVHKPKQPQDMNLSIAIDNHKCMKLPKNNFKLRYYIYGDWAETQEGELTVKILKETGSLSNAAG